MHAVMFRSLSIVTLEMQHEREKNNQCIACRVAQRSFATEDDSKVARSVDVRLLISLQSSAASQLGRRAFAFL